MSHNPRVTVKTTTASYTLDDNLVVYGDNTYSYDADGYLQTKTTPEGTTTYSYGTMGELLSVTTPTKTISYKHNANNQRVAKLVNGTVTEKYLWANLTTLLAIYDANDNLVQRFEYADSRMPVAMTSNGQKYYLHYDQVGSLRAITDDSHNIVKEIVYDTFGNILSDSNPTLKVPFGFAGGLYDSDTKLTRFGYRDYDAYTGKWTAKDPIGFSGGDSNLYGYVLGDPVGFVDPEGKNPLLIIPLVLILTDTYLNAPTDENEVYDGLTPMNELGLCLVGPKFLKDTRPKNGFHHGPHHNFGTKKNPAWRDHIQFQTHNLSGMKTPPIRIPFGTKYPLKYGKYPK